MTKLREGLDKCRQEREAQEGWFESMFYHSPWLTILLSTLAGPLVLLFLLLSFGPCIINQLTQFVKDLINAVQLMVLRHQYQAIPTPAL